MWEASDYGLFEFCSYRDFWSWFYIGRAVRRYYAGVPA